MAESPNANRCWLLRSFRVTAAKDNGVFRRLLLKKYLEQHPIRRSLYKILEGQPGFAATGAVIYGLTCALRLRRPQNEPITSWLAITGTDNEFKAVSEGVDRFYPGKRVSHARLRRLPRLSPSDILALMNGLALGDLLRFRRVARRLLRRHDLLIAMRCLSILGYHAAVRIMLRSNTTEMLLFSSESAPYTLAATPWISKGAVRSAFFEHGLPTPVHTPVLFDFIHLWGEESLRIRSDASRLQGAVMLFGGGTKNLRLPQGTQGLHIGIFPSMTTQWNELKSVLERVSREKSVARILVKPHPNRHLLPGRPLSALRIHQKVEVLPPRTRLEEVASRLDLMISGNSSIHIDALRSGVPSFYLSAIDEAPDDFYGFVSGGLVPRMPEDLGHFGDAARHHYGDPRWMEQLSRYLSPQVRTAR